MANYSLILDTKFKPFTYDELIKAPLMETQAHQAIEEAYGELTQKASVWEEMADEQSDPYAYNLYKTYAKDLNDKADQLLRQGLDVSSRKGMLDMRARYSKEILPIENAYKRREELSAEQRKAMAANPTMLYERYANQMSLDDFIKDPSLDYGAQYSGALLTQQVATAASNLAKEVNTPEGRRKIRKMLTDNGRWIPYQYEVELQKGFTREDVDKAIRGDADANPILTSIVDGVLQASGINSWGDASTRNLARYYANQGLYNAIGTKEYSNITDSYNMQIGIEGEKNRRSNTNPFNDPGKGRFPIFSRSIALNNSKKGEKNDVLRKIFGTRTDSSVAGVLDFVGDMIQGYDASKAIELHDSASKWRGYRNPYTFSYKDNKVINTNSGSYVVKDDFSGSFYDRNGNLLSKEEFYKDPININFNEDYYDIQLSHLAEYLDIPKSKLPKTYERIEEAISNVEAGKGSGLIQGIELPMNPGDTQEAIRRAIMYNNDGEDKLRITKVSGFNDDGSIKQGDRIEANDLLDDEGELKEDGYFTLIDFGGKANLLFTSGSESYYIPLSSLSNIAESANIEVDRILEIQEKIKEVGGGDDSWYSYVLNNATSENLANPNFANLYDLATTYEGALKNAGAAQVSKLVISLLSNYKGTDFKVSSQTGDYDGPYTLE